MDIQTKFFGLKSVAEEEVITFNHGIPGFEEHHRYVILNYEQESLFQILQSVDNSELALILVELEKVLPSYSFDLEDEIVADLKLSQPEDAKVYAVVVIPQDISKSTVNLAAPVIVNTKSKKAQQIILNNPAYNLRHPLFMEEEKPAVKSVASK